MRWKNKQPIETRPGDQRERYAFALKPTQIGKHTVWLERYLITEVAVVTPEGKLEWLELGKSTLDYYY